MGGETSGSMIQRVPGTVCFRTRLGGRRTKHQVVPRDARSKFLCGVALRRPPHSSWAEGEAWTPKRVMQESGSHTERGPYKEVAACCRRPQQLVSNSYSACHACQLAHYIYLF